ncbi:hypothetical protein [Pararoseomonas baculiformis]|nr:hypothetical protein [Pararoseomonas baculiformis]
MSAFFPFNTRHLPGHDDRPPRARRMAAAECDIVLLGGLAHGG